MFNKSKLLTLTVVKMLGQNVFGSEHIRGEDRKDKSRDMIPGRHSCISAEQKTALRVLLAEAASSVSPVPGLSPVPDLSHDLEISTSPVLFGTEVGKDQVVLVSPKGVVRRSSMEEIRDALTEAQLFSQIGKPL